jgi:hypothetical protein
MHVEEESIRIDRPVQEVFVFDYVSEADNLPA